MPLKAGYSPEIIGKNIAMEVKRGTPHEQAIAIALNMARREYRNIHPVGPFPHHLKGAGKFYSENPTGTRKRNKEWIITAKVLSTGEITDVLELIAPTKEDAVIKASRHLVGKGMYDLSSLKAIAKNPVSEKTAHKLRKAAPGTFAKMTDEEIKRAVKVKKRRARKNPVRPLKKRSPRPFVAKKFSGDYFVDVLGGDPQQWMPLASFIQKDRAVQYAKAFSNRTGKKTRVYKDEPSK